MISNVQDGGRDCCELTKKSHKSASSNCTIPSLYQFLQWIYEQLMLIYWKRPKTGFLVSDQVSRLYHSCCGWDDVGFLYVTRLRIRLLLDFEIPPFNIEASNIATNLGLYITEERGFFILCCGFVNPCIRSDDSCIKMLLLPPAYVVRREGNSFTVSVHTWGGVRSSCRGGGSGPAGGGGVRSSRRGGSGPAGGGSASCALLRAVCLLRSHRRTFLFLLVLLPGSARLWSCSHHTGFEVYL